VDSEHFKPRPKDFLAQPRPIFLYMGRVAIEKNIEAFLKLDLPGTKMVIGGGPDLETLRRNTPPCALPATVRRGTRQTYRGRGRIRISAAPILRDGDDRGLACGIPVAAYPVQGPLDDRKRRHRLPQRRSARSRARALKLSPGRCREAAMKFTWRPARASLSHLEAARRDNTAALAAVVRRAESARAGPASRRSSRKNGSIRFWVRVSR
jgi:hypothetical protein